MKDIIFEFAGVQYTIEDFTVSGQYEDDIQVEVTSMGKPDGTEVIDAMLFDEASNYLQSAYPELIYEHWFQSKIVD